MTLVSIISYSQTSQYVNGYYRSNGKYVQGYYRTIANNTVSDNYSTIGNVNPYTGKRGTKTYYVSSKSNRSYNYYKQKR